MTIWQQLDQGPEKKLRHWQRKAHVLGKKAARDGRVQNIVPWRIWSALLFLLVLATSLLANATYRHWFTAALANIAIIGGILAAPIMSLIAWIGVILPVHAPLHRAAPTLFIGALLWMVMGFVSAHVRREDTDNG